MDLDSINRFSSSQFYPHGGGTALWGSVGICLNKINESGPVLFVVITDGEDNSSHTYGAKEVNESIAERQKLGNYTFAYLGVAKEAWGQEAKVHAFHSSNRNVAGADYNANTYRDLAAVTKSYSATMSGNSTLLSRGVSDIRMSVNNLFDQPAVDASELVHNVTAKDEEK